jgi:hypothetical protein
MKITEETMKILKNFATINPSILIRKGSMLATQSIPGNILAEVTVKEDFPCEFALYDLVEFLNTLKLFSTPVLDFTTHEDNYLIIYEEDSPSIKVKYTFGNKDHIKFPKKRPVLPSTEVTFNFEMTTLDSILKAANVMQLPNMSVLPGKDIYEVSISVSDAKDKSSNKFSFGADGTYPEGVIFNLIFKMDTFKMLPNDYTVSISKNRLAAFESDSVDYYIGLDVSSTYDGE